MLSHYIIFVIIMSTSVSYIFIIRSSYYDLSFILHDDGESAIAPLRSSAFFSRTLSNTYDCLISTGLTIMVRFVSYENFEF